MRRRACPLSRRHPRLEAGRVSVLPVGCFEFSRARQNLRRRLLVKQASEYIALRMVLSLGSRLLMGVWCGAVGTRERWRSECRANGSGGSQQVGKVAWKGNNFGKGNHFQIEETLGHRGRGGAIVSRFTRRQIVCDVRRQLRRWGRRLFEELGKFVSSQSGPFIDSDYRQRRWPPERPQAAARMIQRE